MKPVLDVEMQDRCFLTLEETKPYFLYLQATPPALCLLSATLWPNLHKVAASMLWSLAQITKAEACPMTTGWSLDLGLACLPAT